MQFSAFLWSNFIGLGNGTSKDRKTGKKFITFRNSNKDKYVQKCSIYTKKSTFAIDFHQLRWITRHLDYVSIHGQLL